MTFPVAAHSVPRCSVVMKPTHCCEYSAWPIGVWKDSAFAIGDRHHIGFSAAGDLGFCCRQNLHVLCGASQLVIQLVLCVHPFQWHPLDDGMFTVTITMGNSSCGP